MYVAAAGTIARRLEVPPEDGRGSEERKRAMHEMGIAMSIYDSCRAAVAKHGGGRMEEVQVAVGELSALEPELLRFAWEAVVENGPHAGCRLVIDWRPAHQLCPACGAEKPRAAGSWLRLCPDCGGPLQLEGGDDLDILHVSFVSYDAGGGDRA